MVGWIELTYYAIHISHGLIELIAAFRALSPDVADAEEA